ncbi:MAG: hypothetical protein OXC67_02555 [Flavobacteriaceae bacterium]|nr:hypothetical protein [Flavobacteriaceae bacterium]
MKPHTFEVILLFTALLDISCHQETSIIKPLSSKKINALIAEDEIWESIFKSTDYFRNREKGNSII